MSWSVDSRVPVVFGAGEVLEPGDALLRLVEAGREISAIAHPVDCSCCQTRSKAARALALMFLQRARGEIPFFRRVVCVVADAGDACAVRDALASDPLVSARFRAG